MLARLQTVLRRAQRGKYAVGAFNVSNLEQTQAVIQAARKLRAPVIVNTSEKAIAYAGLEEITAFVLAMAKKYPIPIVLDLDHGRDVRLARRCLAAGYSGLMFDGSRWPLKKNIQLTKSVVQAGQPHGVGVEGELGQVKYPDELKKSSAKVLTDPDEAAAFVRQTGVCALAVAIGNSHVIPRDTLDFRLLRQIAAKVRVPLVLHGASGTAAPAIRKAIALGITKINIDTDLRIAFTAAIRKVLTADRNMYDPRAYLTPARQALMDTVMKKIKLFGSRRQGV